MVETERLLIIPLTYNQLIKYIKNDNSLEEELQLNSTSRIISEELIEALENTILPNVADESKNYLYSTLWALIYKQENRIVGDLCFVGEPNENGEIEVGYGTYSEFQNKGFMTEALSGMIHWAENQPNVKAIVASTEKENTASFSVLIKNNFIKIGEKDNLIHWILKFNK